MRKIGKLIIVTLILVLFTGCYDRDIIDRKDFNHSLPKVENLSYTLEGNGYTLMADTRQYPPGLQSTTGSKYSGGGG